MAGDRPDDPLSDHQTLADRPFSPWVEGNELSREDRLRLEVREHSTLDELGWRGDAELYRVLMKVGIKPNEADEMELAQVAIVLGADLNRAQPFPEELWEKEKDTLADRAKAIREMKPRPEQEEDITAQVMRQMGIRTE